MKSGFYSKLAVNNIKKNYRFFIPRILAEVGLLACFYISITLAMDSRILDLKGGEYVSTLMIIGVIVLSLLSIILMFYVNSFLMKQRKREFGVYNILGMEKRHIGRVLFCESIFACICSVVCGLVLGVLFYKLCSLFICNLLKADIILGFYFITPKTIIPAAGFFILVDLIAFGFNRISIAKLKPVELLSSKSTGEKEPKIKWVMLVIGILCLAAGYYISITTTNPLEALEWFFIAVVLVIIGTYFLFVSGSIFVLKSLKNNKKYYYNKKHMPSISGLLYRMKQNAVGLASIAILSTGVLVMVSTTFPLYYCRADILAKTYPQHMYLDAHYETTDGKTQNIPTDVLESVAVKVSNNHNIEIKSIQKDEYLSVNYCLDNNTLYTYGEVGNNVDYSKISQLIFITADTYNNITGEHLQLEGNQIATCRISSPVGTVENLDGTITIRNNQYNVVKTLNSFPITPTAFVSGFYTYGVVVSDDSAMNTIYQNQKETLGEYASEYTSRIAVTFKDLEKACSVGSELQNEMRAELYDYVQNQPDVATDSFSCYNNSYWSARDALNGMYGSFLFLGILLAAVCLFATVLIIYYKQISEGYEDSGRFQIMEKIGMSKKEVKKTINSQVLLVFFLPIVVAGIHLAFAFPILERLLKILMLYDDNVLINCTLITFAVFTLVYVLIYKITSRTYYKIVQ